MRADPRQGDQHDLPGADDQPQPGADRRRADRRDAAAASRACPRRDAERRAVEMLTLVGIPAPARRVREYPHQLVRRHAPARDDRHGAGLQPEAADRRRADHRARRHHPGADPRPDARPEDAARLGDHADHPRSRRGRRNGAARGGDVCRPQGGGGARWRRSSPARASLHARPARRGAEARLVAGAGRAHASSRKFRGQVPSLREPIVGCAFAGRCAAGDRPVPRGGAGGGGEAPGPFRRLPLRRARAELAA